MLTAQGRRPPGVPGSVVSAIGSFMCPCHDGAPTTQTEVFLVPAIYLTTRFLANGRLVNEQTGLERSRALAQ
jgi:hypothetical protein